MSIKAFVYAAQRHLDSVINAPNKRTHIHELIAAACGASTRAALDRELVFSEHRKQEPEQALITAIQQRAIELGYDVDSAVHASTILGGMLIERRLGTVHISTLIDELRVRDDYPSLMDCNPFLTYALTESHWPILLDSLRAAAGKGNPDAHYALALFYEDGADGEPESDGAYWHQEAQRGRVLSGIEKEWADAYAEGCNRREQYAKHLRAAADLGHPDALFDMADRFDDPSFFQQMKSSVNIDPAHAAEVAERLGHVEDARHWWTVAAREGDVDAMRWLVEHDEGADPFECWVWVYLAQLFGTDFTQNAASAVHEDGSPYDDEIGGPIYAVSKEAVNLEPLSREEDRRAQHEAAALFQRLDFFQKPDLDD